VVKILLIFQAHIYPMVESGFDVKAYAAMTAGGKFQPHTIKRRNVGDNDVHIETAYAGICHSDIHQAREEWGPAIFPMVPGHEIAGVVVAVGKNVTKFKVGDHAGVGCFVDSCRNCDQCKKGTEQYCKTGMVGTYNGREKYPHCPGYKEKADECAPTYGGYSQHIVVD
jgi:alcohol dehydrogenase (NADP+)